MELYFKKDHLSALIAGASPSEDFIVITDEYESLRTTPPSFRAVFKARRTRDCSKGSISTDEVRGCPNPPGCSGETLRETLDAMN